MTKSSNQGNPVQCHDFSTPNKYIITAVQCTPATEKYLPLSLSFFADRLDKLLIPRAYFENFAVLSPADGPSEEEQD